MKDKPPDGVGDVGDADFDFGARKADGPDLHPHAMFLIGEDVLDKGADL